MKKEFIKNSLLVIFCWLASTAMAFAEVYAPTPTATNEKHWNTILGAGSYKTYSTGIRSMCCLIIFFVTAWVFWGLYLAFIGQRQKPHELAMYAMRMLIIVTFAISLIVN